jgi:hypothetical protein
METSCGGGLKVCKKKVSKGLLRKALLKHKKLQPPKL